MAVVRSSNASLFLVVVFSILALIGCDDILGVDDDDDDGDGNGVSSTITLTDPDGVETEFSVTEGRWDYRNSFDVGFVAFSDESSIAVSLFSNEDPLEAEFPVEVTWFFVSVRIDGGDLEDASSDDNINVELTLEPAESPTTVTATGTVSGFDPQSYSASSNNNTYSLQISINNLSISELDDEHSYMGPWFREHDLYPQPQD